MWRRGLSHNHPRALGILAHVFFKRRAAVSARMGPGVPRPQGYGMTLWKHVEAMELQEFVGEESLISNNSASCSYRANLAKLLKSHQQVTRAIKDEQDDITVHAKLISACSTKINSPRMKRVSRPSGLADNAGFHQSFVTIVHISWQAKRVRSCAKLGRQHVTNASHATCKTEHQYGVFPA